VVINSQALANEVSEPAEKRFRKNLATAIRQVRNAVGDGLFTVRFWILLYPYPSLNAFVLST
jgi:hypothetical protein